MNVGDKPSKKVARSALELSRIDGPHVVRSTCKMTLSDNPREDESFVYKHTYGSFLSFGIRRLFYKDAKEVEDQLTIFIPQSDTEKATPRKVPSATIVQIIYTDHVSYVFELITRKGESIINYARYSEFDRFHEVFKVTVAELPPKRWFFNMDLEFVKEREKLLQAYIDTVIKHPCFGRYLEDFLSAKKNGLELLSR